MAAWKKKRPVVIFKKKQGKFRFISLYNLKKSYFYDTLQKAYWFRYIIGEENSRYAILVINIATTI